MEPVFLSLDEVLEATRNRSSDMADLPDSAMRLDLNQQWRRPRLPSTANSCIAPFRRWRPRTSFTSARTIHSSTGNKRVGANAAVTFLFMNNREPTFDEDQLVDVVLGVVSGGLTKLQLIEVFESHCRPSGNT